MAPTSSEPTNRFYKVLFVGKFSPDKSIYTYATSFVRTLESMGHIVHSFNNKKNYLPFPANTHDDLTARLKPINDIIINRALLKTAQNLKPDLIFFIKAENIFPKTIAELKRLTSAHLINFYPDNPFTFWNGNSSSNVLLALPLYDQFLIWSKQLIPILQAAGSKQASYFPFAYDEEIFSAPVTILEQDLNFYKSDLVFAGTWDQERESYLSAIATHLPSLTLNIWGNRWQEMLSPHSPIRKALRGQAIYGTEMLKAFRCSKIVLNFIRQQNLDGHNMRTFEALASGSFMLTEHTTDQTELPFVEGENIATFSGVDDLLKKIAFYINNATLREDVAHRGAAIAAQFTLSQQLKKILAHNQ